MDMEQPPRSGPHVPPAPGLGVPASHQVVRIVSKPGVFQAAIGVILGVAALGIVFFVGMSLGAFTMFAGSMAESPIVHEMYRDGDRNQVAIIEVKGVIDPLRAHTVRVLVDEVLATRAIKAVVLRVDSPGGGIAPSDQIWYQVNRMRDAGLPVVASFGGVAASGGYYISCGTDHIVAEPTCITGSIGVIAHPEGHGQPVPALDRRGPPPVRRDARRRLCHLQHAGQGRPRHRDHGSGPDR
jgi:membrane-bound ClpP family serine protease